MPVDFSRVEAIEYSIQYRQRVANQRMESWSPKSGVRRMKGATNKRSHDPQRTGKEYSLWNYRIVVIIRGCRP